MSGENLPLPPSVVATLEAAQRVVAAPNQLRGSAIDDLAAKLNLLTPKA